MPEDCIKNINNNAKGKGIGCNGGWVGMWGAFGNWKWEIKLEEGDVGAGLVVGNCQIDNKDASCSQSVTECKAAGAVPVV